jgi:hypothetical protein
LVANQPDPDHTDRLADSQGHSNVLWLGPSYGTPPAPETVEESNQRIDDDTVAVDNPNGLPDPAPTVVHSERVDNLHPGDVLEAEASGVHLKGVGFDHSAESWWVLSPNAGEDGRFLPATGSGRYMSGRNGINCLDPNHRSINDVFGGVVIPRDGECFIGQNGAVAVPSNASPTMYLNYVVEAVDGSRGPNPRVDVLGGNFDFKCDPQRSIPPDTTQCTFGP